MGGRAYPVRHYPIAIRLRDRKGHAILCLALFPQSGDSSGARLEVPFKALLHPESYVRKMLNILQFASNIFNCAGCALALSDTVVPSRTPPAKMRVPPRKYGRIMQPICNKIALESKLSRNFVANVHYLLYLCSEFR